jgi:hypothetical protein
VLSLKEAAEAVGMGKPAILKAIQKGKISAKKDAHGQWWLDPAELHRVYPPVSGSAQRTGSSGNGATTGNGHQNKLLERELEFMREKLASAERIREDERHQFNARIEELRRDKEELKGDRDRLLRVIEEQAGTVKLLMDQSQKATAVVSTSPKQQPGLLARLFGTRTA